MEVNYKNLQDPLLAEMFHRFRESYFDEDGSDETCKPYMNSGLGN